MTVLENVMVGLHTKSRSGIISCAFKLPRQIKEEKQIKEKALHWLEFTGLADEAEIRLIICLSARVGSWRLPVLWPWSRSLS